MLDIVQKLPRVNEPRSLLIVRNLRLAIPGDFLKLPISDSRG
jgi:hypothetical protein